MRVRSRNTKISSSTMRIPLAGWYVVNGSKENCIGASSSFIFSPFFELFFAVLPLVLVLNARFIFCAVHVRLAPGTAGVDRLRGTTTTSHRRCQ